MRYTFTSTEAFTGDDTLTAAESGKICTNVGAAATVTLTAPPAVKGLWFGLRRVADFAVRFDPSGTERVQDCAAGKYLEVQSEGLIIVICHSDGIWTPASEQTALWASEA